MSSSKQPNLTERQKADLAEIARLLRQSAPPHLRSLFEDTECQADGADDGFFMRFGRKQGSIMPKVRSDSDLSAERLQILRAALDDPTGEGFAIIGEELALPVADIYDYESWVRKSLAAHLLQPKEHNVVKKGRMVTALSYDWSGENILHVSDDAISFKPQEFPTCATPGYFAEDWQDDDAFDTLDRTQQTIRTELMAQDDQRLRALFDEATKKNEQVIKAKRLTASVLRDAISILDDHGTPSELIHMNRRDLSNLIVNDSKEIDPVINRELAIAGYVGQIDGVKLITAARTGVEEVLSPNILYVTCAQNLLGEVGVRILPKPNELVKRWKRWLSSEPFQQGDGKVVKGWKMGFTSSMTITNPNGVVKIVIR